MTQWQAYEALTARALAKAQELAPRLAYLPSIAIRECADGSRRYFAAVGADEEHLTYTPAPDEAPAWARREFPNWVERTWEGE